LTQGRLWLVVGLGVLFATGSAGAAAGDRADYDNGKPPDKCKPRDGKPRDGDKSRHRGKCKPPKPPQYYYPPPCRPTEKTIIGSERSDRLKGTRKADLILAFGGNDRADGKSDDDCLVMGDGHDRAEGGSGDDWILGERGKDRLKGERGDDRVRGGSGRDEMWGGRGRDLLRAADNRRDESIDCGRGWDVAVIDRSIDPRPDDCEVVIRRR
jgi:Ca2+-binding RTX toxin-like protein